MPGSIDDLLDRDADFNLGNTVDALECALANLHVEDEFPRLSVVPFEEDHILISRSIIPDEQHHTAVSKVLNRWPLPHIAAHMIISTSNGHACFANDWCHFGSREVMNGHRIIAHSTYPLAEIHAFLFNNETPSPTLSLRTLDMNLLQQAGVYYESLMHCFGRLVDLTKYVTQSIVFIRASWRTASVLPRRLLNMNDSLDGMDIPTALFHLAMTGHAFAQTYEWIVEELGAASIKRWREASHKGLQNTLDGVLLYLLPAIQRTGVVATRLRGMSRVPQLARIIPEQARKGIEHMFQDLSNLRLIAHAVLNYSRLELLQSETFHDWLSNTCTFLQDPTSSAADDAAKQLAALDYDHITSYITGALTNSHLRVFTEQTTQAILDAPFERIDRQMLLADLERHRLNPIAPDEVELINVLYQGMFFRSSITAILEPSFAAVLDGMRLSRPVTLETEPASEIQAMRSVYANDLIHYVLSVPAVGRNKLRVHCVIESDLHTYTLHLGRGTIKDVAFMSDAVFAVLWRTHDASYLLQFPYTPSAASFILPSTNDTVAVTDITPHILQSFAHPSGEGSFVPAFIRINDRKGRGNVLVGENDMLRYRIYNLETSKNETL